MMVCFTTGCVSRTQHKHRVARQMFYKCLMSIFRINLTEENQEWAMGSLVGLQVLFFPPYLMIALKPFS